MKEFVEKLIGRLEEKRFNCDLECASYKNKGGTLFRCADAQRVAYVEAIEIVNQLAEEYINDFCEWKKTDKRKSSPYHHALKHGNITLEFHDDFKFCPYCGKKIKIAPYQPKGE